MIIAGIDTGRRGAVVVADTESSFAKFELLKYDDEGHLKNDLTSLLKRANLVIIEKIHGRGGWSANTSFKMGYYLGQIVDHVRRINSNIEYVTPVMWTSVVHRELDFKANAKAKSLAAYHLYHPHDPILEYKGRKVYHDGLVDAFLIVTYYILTNNGKLPKWIFAKEKDS